MTCVPMVSFSVPRESDREIRCRRIFSSFVQKALTTKLGRDGQKHHGSTYYYGADDNLFFCKATIFEWVHIQDILQVYEEASG